MLGLECLYVHQTDSQRRSELFLGRGVVDCASFADSVAIETSRSCFHPLLENFTWTIHTRACCVVSAEERQKSCGFMYGPCSEARTDVIHKVVQHLCRERCVGEPPCGLNCTRARTVWAASVSIIIYHSSFHYPRIMNHKCGDV